MPEAPQHDQELTIDQLRAELELSRTEAKRWRTVAHALARRVGEMDAGWDEARELGGEAG